MNNGINDNNIKDNSQTQPISIIKPLQKYTLKHGLFDPIQSSPPSIWKTRLMNRLNNTLVSQSNSSLLPTTIKL